MPTRARPAACSLGGDSDGSRGTTLSACTPGLADA
jgi:hypothetical protein